MTRTVPTSFPTIQQAINASSSGDTVLVLPGTYVENLVIHRPIVVRSAQGPASTIIDGGEPDHPDSASTVRMSQGTIQGFDIRNGTGTVWGATATRLGGGILVQDGGAPGPVVRGNWIHGNRVEESARSAYGGGVAMRTPGQVIGNRIFGNTLESTTRTATGAAIWGSGTISSNEIFDNHVTLAGGSYWGGAILCGEGQIDHNVIACNSGGHAAALNAGGTVESNTIVANWSVSGDAAVYLSDQGVDQLVIFLNNNVTQNIAAGVTCFAPAPTYTFDFGCNNVFGNTPSGQVMGDCSDVLGQDGNISVDPQYGRGNCPPQAGDFCVVSGSPLLPENSPPGCGLIGARGLCTQIGIADETLAPEAEGNRVSVQPNPFATRTTLVIDLVAAAAIELRITNALGRVVAEQSLGTLHAGRHRWTWDGRDAAGNRAAAGVYYAELQTGGRPLVTRLMVLR